MVPAPSLPDPTGPLLEELLVPLLQDYAESFERGLELLSHCPESVMAAPEQAQLRERLEEARRSLAAARALRAAAPKPMGLAMETITPWHRLVVDVWTLSARMRASGGVP
jgi:sugar phosphate isomerase/epimerase